MAGACDQQALELELVLTLGPSSDDEFPAGFLEAVYWENRDHLLRHYAQHGDDRPWGWWQFEGPPELADHLPILFDVDDPDGIAEQRADLEARRQAWLMEEQETNRPETNR